MATSITLSTTALAALLSRLNPAPDDPGPWGPGGPVLADLTWFALNPQPLPPRWARRGGPSPDPWRWGPQPDPWRFAVAVRFAVSRLIDQYEQAGIIVIGGDVERLAEVSGQQIRALVDELCGTPPRPRPFPRPWGPELDVEELDPTWQLLAAAQLTLAGQGLGDDHPLAPLLAEGGDAVFRTAAARLEG